METHLMAAQLAQILLLKMWLEQKIIELLMKTTLLKKQNTAIWKQNPIIKVINKKFIHKFTIYQFLIYLSQKN